MAVIYLKHPIHGTKVACGQQEASYDKSHGWVEFDPEKEYITQPEINKLPDFLAVNNLPKAESPKVIRKLKE